MIDKPSQYAQAGVDIAAADKAKAMMKKLVESTYNGSVIGGHGGFGGMYSLFELTGTNQILVGSADGVGTKLKLAFMTGRHNTVGQDLINHCVNDILCCGARPLFFFDYMGLGKLEPDIVTQIVGGLAIACKENDMVLLGGETAEMPGFYPVGEYDLAGFIVGWVSKDKIIDGRKIKAGDQLIGLAAGGLHTNGYSLARRVFFDTAEMGINDKIEETGTTVAEALMVVHRSYLKIVEPFLNEGVIRGIAHITGGGFEGNINRIIPDGLTAVVDTSKWRVPGVFKAIERLGHVEAEEMYRVFNMGIGLILICNGADSDKLIKQAIAGGVEAFKIGNIEPGDKKVILKF
jgi:phosphoribosylformylglycinamidine cyclo-ligase